MKPADTLGKKLDQLNSIADITNVYEELKKHLYISGVWEGEIYYHHKNGNICIVRFLIKSVNNADGEITNYVGSIFDITKNREAENQIQHLAFYDALTSLPNRRLLQDRLNQAVANSIRSGYKCAVLFLDLDHFKTLNDTLGHDFGDLLLQQVANRLITCVRDGDTIARLGGDEFVIVLESLSKQTNDSASQVENIAKKILNKLSQPYELQNKEYQCTLSIGATLFNEYKLDASELLKQADIALFQAKKSGRNTFRFFDTHMQILVNARAEIERELHKALEKSQFQLYYQLQIDDLFQPVGLEALIRWQHPLRGLVSPVDFIPLAEESGLILAIGQWVLNAACEQLKIWEKSLIASELTMSVNVSAKQFHQLDFVEQVLAIVQRHDINPKKLRLELTEGMLIDDVSTVISSMNTLAEVGIRFELDDFGTGYSSLNYLKNLPLYQLKIDQSFVSQITNNSSDQAIVKTIISMAESLGLKVIAEGVETEEQFQELKAKGCKLYQGYFISKPLPVDEFEKLLFKN